MNGTLVSFNIEKLDTGYWNKIDEVLVKNEEMVKEDQKLLKTSNSEANGEIYSTIAGRFYVQEENGNNSYYIYDLDNVGIEIDVDEEESVKLKIGQKVNVKFTGSSETIEGKVFYIQKIPNKGNIKVKVKIEYNDKYKFGTNAKIEILTNEEPDTSVKEYDLINTVHRIGKTKIILKNQPDITDSIQDYLSQMGNELNLGDLDLENLDNLDQFGDLLPGEDGENSLEPDGEQEFDVEELSEYYSNLWNDYWKEYWKSYYEEYQTFQVVEPDGIIGDENKDDSKNIDKDLNNKEKE